jgi:hypothetical protein
VTDPAWSIQRWWQLGGDGGVPVAPAVVRHRRVVVLGWLACPGWRWASAS